jgi:hypothetical protein
LSLFGLGRIQWLLRIPSLQKTIDAARMMMPTAAIASKTNGLSIKLIPTAIISNPASCHLVSIPASYPIGLATRQQRF